MSLLCGREVLAELLVEKPFEYEKYSVHNLLLNRPFVLYGAGDGFVTFSVFILQKYGFSPALVLDEKFVEKEGRYHGIPACPPEHFCVDLVPVKDCPVIITVGKAELHQEIKRTLYKLGFNKILLATDIYEYHLLYESEEIRQRGFAFFQESKNRIFRAFDLFEDEMSQVIFTRMLEVHAHRKPLHIPNCPSEDQYFPKDVPLTKGYDKLIHCGAYNGDTVKSLVRCYGKIQSLACFEPEEENYSRLVTYLTDAHSEVADSVVAIPCGVYSHDCQLSFSSGNKINSSISSDGNTAIQCVAIDHILPGFAPTLIVMDIEGSEPQALIGAKKTIATHQPDLAICIYHSPEHLWEVPLCISEMQTGYRYYLRNYSSFPSETVLYAVAE